MSIQLTSTAFPEGKPIPEKYTCDGADVSPPLKWANVPDGTKSIALISDDPDAPVGTWVHWVIYNIPPEATELAEGIPKSEVLTNGATQGMTDFKRIGYGGPCPPRGGPHRGPSRVRPYDPSWGPPTPGGARGGEGHGERRWTPFDGP